MTYISSQSLMSPLRGSVLQAQAALSQAQIEISTGNKADIGVALGARTGVSLSLKSEVDRLNGYASSNSLATTRLGSTATALSAMLTGAQSIAASLVTASGTGGTPATLQASAKAALQALIGGLNTASGGQHVFAGINTDTQPIGDYFSAQTSSAKAGVDDAFRQSFGFSQTDEGAAAISGSAMESFLDGAFADQFSDASWSANWSSASNQTISTTVSPTQSTATSVSANATAFRTIAEAYTMLSEFTGSTMSSAAQASVVAKATALVNAGIAALTNTQSAVGIAQATISTATTQITAQVNVLTTSVSDLDGVDTYGLSSRVTALQTQLEASYALTSRLQQLSLVNYLSG